MPVSLWNGIHEAKTWGTFRGVPKIIHDLQMVRVPSWILVGNASNENKGDWPYRSTWRGSGLEVSVKVLNHGTVRAGVDNREDSTSITLCHILVGLGAHVMFIQEANSRDDFCEEDSN